MWIPIKCISILLIFFVVHDSDQKELDSPIAASEEQERKNAIPRKSMEFGKDQLYRDFFSLSKNNFTKTVVHSRMAWVIYFHEGMLERSWKLSASNLRGIIRFGMIDIKVEPQLVKELKLAENTTARMYPYGGKIVKRKFYEDLQDAMEAVSKAEQSLPDKIPRIDDKQSTDDFLLEAYHNTPTKFPALILTRETSTPIMFRALALRFARYFNFNLFRDPSVSKMRKLGLPTDFYYQVPGIVVIITKNFGNPSERRFFAVQFDKSLMGELTYPNCIMFLMQTNRQLRHTLPGENEASNEHTVKATDVLKAEEEIFDIKEDNFSGSARMVPPKSKEPKPDDNKDPYMQQQKDEL